MTAAATLVWLFNLLCDVVGQLAFKAAAVSAGDKDGLARWLEMAKNRWIWLGVCAYICEILSWIALLSMVPLSVAVLLGCLAILCVMVGGRIVFAEKITKQRALAVSLIAIGVGLVGWGGGL